LLLNNLNKDYEYIVTVITQSIRTSNSNINVKEIIAQLLDEFRRLSSIKTSYPRNTSTSISTSKSSYNKPSSYSNNIEMSMQTSNYNSNTKNKANKPILKCTYYKLKGHTEFNYLKKNPSLRKNKSINNSSTKEEVQILASSIKSINNNTIDFILDSGAIIHTCCIKELFTSIKPSNTTIKWGNTNKTIKAQGVGDINIVFTSTRQLAKLTNVLFVPDLGVNLLSLSLITSKSYSLSFNKDSCFIRTPKNALLAKGSYKEGVSVFSATSSKLTKAISYTKTYATINTSNSLEEVAEVEDSNTTLSIEQAVNLEDNNTSNNKTTTLNNNAEKVVLNKNTIELAHNRLGHISLKSIKHLTQNATGEESSLVLPLTFFTTYPLVY
jgi:hypothetical protein